MAIGQFSGSIGKGFSHAVDVCVESGRSLLGLESTTREQKRHKISFVPEERADVSIGQDEGVQESGKGGYLWEELPCCVGCVSPSSTFLTLDGIILLPCGKPARYRTR